MYWIASCLQIGLDDDNQLYHYKGISYTIEEHYHIHFYFMLLFLMQLCVLQWNKENFNSLVRNSFSTNCYIIVHIWPQRDSVVDIVHLDWLRCPVNAIDSASMSTAFMFTDSIKPHGCVCVCNDVPTQTLHCVLVPNGIAYTQALDCRSYDKPNAQRTSKICYTHTHTGAQ